MCQTELPDKGDVWTGRDVEQAFRSPEVQKSLTANDAACTADAPAKLTARDKTLRWVGEYDKCLAQSEGIDHLYDVLRTVMSNLICQ